MGKLKKHTTASRRREMQWVDGIGHIMTTGGEKIASGPASVILSDGLSMDTSGEVYSIMPSHKMLSDLHEQTARLYADGDLSRVKISVVSGEKVKVIVDDIEIDWLKRLRDDLYAYFQESLESCT